MDWVYWWPSKASFWFRRYRICRRATKPSGSMKHSFIATMLYNSFAYRLEMPVCPLCVRPSPRLHPDGEKPAGLCPSRGIKRPPGGSVPSENQKICGAGQKSGEIFALWEAKAFAGDHYPRTLFPAFPVLSRATGLIVTIAGGLAGIIAV